MTPITVPESQILRDHTPVKMSSYANILSELALQNADVTAVMKLLVQHSKKLRSSYEIFFHDACVADTAEEQFSRLLF